MRAMPSARRPASLTSLHAVVPLRSLAGGKARLGEALDAEERGELVLGMLRHTLAVLTAWPPCRRVHVVSPDERLLAAIARPGVDPVHQPGGDLNDGLRLGRAAAMAAGAAAMLILPADLPHLEAAALDHLLEAADAALAAGSGRPVVAIAAADARRGTNGLLLAPPDAIEPAFGPGSLEAHIRAASKADASLQVVTEPALGFDLDTPEDLELIDSTRLAQLVELGQDALAMTDG
jgi:2-phospho-L-lactate guanylyltransferase